MVPAVVYTTVGSGHAPTAAKKTKGQEPALALRAPEEKNWADLKISYCYFSKRDYNKSNQYRRE